MAHHYIYKITNLITGHFYYGAHSARDLFDNYMGSGILIKKAVDYYGIENFEKVMVSSHRTRKAMFIEERKFITKEIISDPNCYNLITGGKRRTKNTFQVKARTKNCKELLNENKNKSKRIRRWKN